MKVYRCIKYPYICGRSTCVICCCIHISCSNQWFVCFKATFPWNYLWNNSDFADFNLPKYFLFV